MNQETGEVVPGRILMEKLPVQRVRQPSQGMPVSLLPGSEGPSDRLPGQALVDIRVFSDVTVVVVIHEGVAVDRVVKREGGDHEEKTKNDVPLFGRGEKAGGLFRRLSCRGRQQKNLTTEDTEYTEAFFVTHLFNHVTNVTYWPRPLLKTIEDTEDTELMHFNEISGAVVDSAMKVYTALGPGLRESVYETCLVHELRNAAFELPHSFPSR